MRTVVVTGVSGSGRIEYLRQVQALAKERNNRLQIIDMWQVMRELSGGQANEATILNWTAQRVQLLDQAYNEVASRLNKIRTDANNGRQAVAVATHAVFYWRSIYIEAFPEHLLELLSPDCFVTVAHNIKDIHQSLEADPHKRFPDISLMDILHWRDREIGDSSRWAQRLRKPHFVVARAEPAQTLHDLIFRPDAKRLYISYPMSYVSETQMKGARRLAGRLRRKGYVVFDPGSVDDAHYVGQLRTARVRKEGPGSRYTRQQLSDLARDVGDQTVKFDYILIDQSSLVIVRYPSVTYAKYIPQVGKVIPDIYIPLSAGVICEMVHGFRGGKRVYALWLPKRIPPSPFFAYHSQMVFRSEDELLHHLNLHDPP